jgi:hypothetical protein
MNALSASALRVPGHAELAESSVERSCRIAIDGKMAVAAALCNVVG